MTIKRTRLEQGNVTYEEIEREAVRLANSLGDLALAVRIYHWEKLDQFARKINLSFRTAQASHFQLDSLRAAALAASCAVDPATVDA